MTLQLEERSRCSVLPKALIDTVLRLFPMVGSVNELARRPPCCDRKQNPMQRCADNAAFSRDPAAVQAEPTQRCRGPVANSPDKQILRQLDDGGCIQILGDQWREGPYQSKHK